MSYEGSTYSNIGMAWGMRVLSPEEPFIEGSEWEDEEWNKAIVLMTDGEMSPSTVYSGYWDSNKSSFDSVANLNTRMQEVCTWLKAAPRNVIIYTITFDHVTSDIRLDGKVVAPLGGRAGLRSKISLREGDVFARDVFVRELQEVWRIYRDAGYANVQADPETSLDLARSVVNVTVPIRRMGHTTIARIRIVAPDATHAAIRQALHVTEGQAFNETAHERAKVQLLALGLFRRVDLSLQAVPSDTFITVTIAAEP